MARNHFYRQVAPGGNQQKFTIDRDGKIRAEGAHGHVGVVGKYEAGWVAERNDFQCCGKTRIEAATKLVDRFIRGEI